MISVVQKARFVTLKDRMTIAATVGGVTYKIAKLAFRPRAADFYLAFPYLRVNSYRSGVVRSPHGVEGAKVDTSGPEFHRSTQPVKLSYHESGHVNAQPQAKEKIRNYPMSRQVPIAQLTGQHIFTLECEGLADYAKATPDESRRNDFWAVDLPEKADRIHMATYAGYSDDQILNKYRIDRGAAFLQRYLAVPPALVVTFTRPHLPAPFKIAFYVSAGPSLRTDSDGPYLLGIMGLNVAAPHIEYVCLHASDIAEAAS